MRRRSTQRRIGAGLMLGSLIGAVLAGGPAFAQDGSDEGTEAEAPVEAHALITHPINDALPDTLFSGFPPQVVCVVFQEACPESTEPLREPIGEALNEVDDNEETSPLQPANPEGLTVTIVGGSARYSSAVAVEMPSLPSGEEYDDFQLTFPQGQPSFSFDSPAFRRAVMAAIQTAGSQDGEVFQEQMGKLLEEEAITEPLLGIEACPLLVGIPEEAAPPQSAAIKDVSEENADGEMEAAVDCLYGANGQFDEDAGTWTFNLTSAAKAWEDGTLKNHGIMLRPTGAPNLAFGDPDTSTNAQVVLDISEAPKATYSSSEPPPPVEPLAPMAPMDDEASSSGGDTSTDTSPSTATRSPSSASGSSSPQSSSVSAPSPTSSGGTSSAPDVPSAEVAPPVDTPSTDQSEPVALDTQNAGSSSEGPWAWLLLPVFGGGALLMARSLNEPVAAAATAAAGGGSGGALTRLVESSSRS